MTLLHRLLAIVDWVLRRDRAERRLDDELQAFIDESAADKMRAGVPPDEARRLARLELGGIEQAKERVRTYRHGGWLDEVGRDARYGARMCARNPAFSLVIIMTLALGIGANTAIFSVIDALMLRWLPVPHPEELALLSLRAPSDQGPGGTSFSYAIARAVADQRQIFSGAAGFTSFVFEAGPPGAIARVPGAMVTGDYYGTLGLTPAAGRLLTRQDDEGGAALTAVISYGYWERQFAASSDAIGRTIRVNGVPVTVVGVSPSGFAGATVGAPADITMAVGALPWVAPDAAPLLGAGNFWLRILARPREGVSVRQAMLRLNGMWRRQSDSLLPPHWPPAQRKMVAGTLFEATPGGTGWTYLRDIYRQPLLVLMGMVGLVLLIACANIATLLLARATGRRREIALRLAMGAGRGRVVRQLLIESALLSAIGAALGVALAWVSGRFLVGMMSGPDASTVLDVTPNRHVLAFAGVAALATAALFGVVPALQATASSPAEALKEDGRVSSSRSRLLPSLVSAQVALSMVLLAGAGLFVRTLQNLRDLDPGFEADGVLLAELEGRRTQLPQDFLDSLRRIQGIASASFSTHTPLSGAVWSEPAVTAGRALPDRDNAYFVGAGPAFFATMGIRVLSGREFTERDAAGAPGVAIVNEAYAERHFAGRNPVGEHLSARVRGQLKDLEIVGVVENIRAAGLREPPPPTVYVAYAQLSDNLPTTLEVRAMAPLGRTAAAIRQALEARLPDAAITVRPLSAQVEATIVQERMMATLAGAFGLLALTLACVGLYGLLAYSVAQRTREIGIRMALGAQAAKVVGLVLGRAARLVAIGIAVGIPAAWAGSRAVRSMLFGLTPADPFVMAAATVLLVGAAQLAAYLPARRAARVDPLTALRHE